MLRPMEIPVNVTQITQAANAMAALAAQTRNVGQAARQVAAGTGGGSAAAAIRQQAGIQAARTNAAAQQIRAQGQLQAAQIRAAAQQVRAQSALARAQAPPAAALSSNPFLRVGQAQQNLQALQAAGAPRAAIQGAQYQLALAQRAQQRAQSLITPPSQSQRIAQAILTSRFGAGGLMPLVGRTMAAAGLTGAAAANAAIGVGAVGAAAFAVQRFGKFVAEASERVHQFGIATTISGGTGAQVARLRGMGVPVGEIAGASGSLRERLGASPMAQAVGAQLGIGPVLPISVGSQNNAAILQAALEALRKVTDGEEQLRKARILGLDTMLDQIRVSDEVWNRGKMLAQANAAIYSPKTLQDARDLAGEQRNLQAGMENLQGALAKTWIKPIKDLTATGATAAGAASKALGTPRGTSAMQFGTAAALWLSNPFGPLAAMAYLAHQAKTEKPGAVDPGTTAQQRNTDALDRVGAELQRLNQNMGGGRRTDSTFPAGYFSGSAALHGDTGFKRYAEEERRALEEHARRLGPGAG